MGVQFSTDDVQDDERYDYWLHRHRDALDTDLRLLTGRHPWFRARCAIHTLGAVEAAILSYGGSPALTAGEARRTAGYPDQLDAYEIKFSIACEQFVVTQDGRQAELRPGDFAIVDMTRPSSAMASGRGPKRVVSLTLPRGTLPLPQSEVAKLTAVPVSGRHGTAALVSTLLRQITTDAAAYDPAEATPVSTAVIDLIATTFAARLDRRPALPPDAQRNMLLRRIYAHIDQHLGDPGLSPTAIAAAHHISLRQLHKFFEPEPHTVAEWIRRRRLDRCRRDLTDPALATRSIGAIAARWGFADATNFHRLFRAAHGTPPGAYRRLMSEQ
ncbi:AraC-like DNA-binding protein [Pseudonocardia hierapolitana]|uniref:AraC-like DNA-binding protein n=1 Tax=Pseudonocardia hierapolitana TaxID=1128676 RepID=A0A561SZX1_9PSEU|nr:helix-turn-helix domain-containing protein [Pseudonocardia hierapolitana]TWF80397.1 AraC-like DNA-binding protein [Pseudonocardia hierapolitana]